MERSSPQRNRGGRGQFRGRGGGPGRGSGQFRSEERPSHVDQTVSNVLSEESILLTRSEAWPLVKPDVKDFYFDRLTKGTLTPYSKRAVSEKSIAIFLLRLLVTPRSQVSAFKNEIYNSFDGTLVPLDCETPARFVKPGTELLNEDGISEIARIHISIFRRLREQLAGSRAGNTKPKIGLNGGANKDCPFGVDCLYQLYACIFEQFLSISIADPKRAVCFVIHKLASEAMHQISMKPIPVTRCGCSCPFKHSSAEKNAINASASMIIKIMMENFVEQIRPIVNEKPVIFYKSGKEIEERYSREDIVAAMEKAGQDIVFLDLATVCIISLDNVSDIHLNSLKPPGDIFQALQNSVEAEYNNMEPNRTDLPYWSYFHFELFFQIKKKVEKRLTIAEIERETSKWRIRERLQAEDNTIKERALQAVSAQQRLDHQEQEIRQKMADIEQIKADLAKKEAELRRRQNELTARMSSINAQSASFDSQRNEESKRRTKALFQTLAGSEYPGYAVPKNVVNCVPRLVSDAFLEKEGFKFPYYESLADDKEKVIYLSVCLDNLYKSHLMNMDIAGRRDLVNHVLQASGFDPYLLFDRGYAYSFLF